MYTRMHVGFVFDSALAKDKKGINQSMGKKNTQNKHTHKRTVAARPRPCRARASGERSAARRWAWAAGAPGSPVLFNSEQRGRASVKINAKG